MNKMTKEYMEEIWRHEHIEQINCLCAWSPEGLAFPGTKSPARPNSVIERGGKKTYGGHDFPPWPKTVNPYPCPEELKERYRRDCPRNAEVLIAAYSQTHTKYDA